MLLKNIDWIQIGNLLTWVKWTLYIDMKQSTLAKITLIIVIIQVKFTYLQGFITKQSNIEQKIKQLAQKHVKNSSNAHAIVKK